LLRLTIYHRRRLKIRLLTMLLLLINRLLLMILLLLKILLLLLKILLLLLILLKILLLMLILLKILLLMRILLLLLLLLLLKKRAELRKRFRLEDVAVRLYLLRPRSIYMRCGRTKLNGLLHACVIIVVVGRVEGNARRQRSADTVRRTRG